MKLEQLSHLTAIVEHRSLRAAARRLGVPQPALTRSIRALEKELGATLFLREASGMVLTEAGRRFHVRASAIVHEAQRARDELAQHSGEASGNVVVGLSIMPHVGMLPHVLEPFRARYPHVRLQLIEGLFPDIESQLREGILDFYLGAAPREAPAPGLVVQHLFDNTRAVVCRKNHPLGRSRSLKSLGDAQWATTAVDYNAEEDLARVFAALGLPSPEVLLQARTAMSLMVALAHSDLLAMLPVQWGEFPLTKDALQLIPVREPLPAPPIVCIRRPDLPLTPAAEHFLDLLLRHQPQEARGKRAAA
ncbi:MAG: LysR family transcriptional regulator [Ramlibacter sp.]|jgi:LysR family transcriptional regulator of abg operon|nr:LysR family transcriptional regulator [Ramlibacter sp.]MDB5912664.1 LysR family transcriptional regulator [Ramlibacter sp.]